MGWIAYGVAVVFGLVGFLCNFAVLVGLPGTWIMIGMAVLIQLTDHWYLPADHTGHFFPWWVLIFTLCLGILGEVLEFAAGALGAKSAGSSRQGMIGAMVGGLLGAFLGIWIPVPLIGSLIGAVLGTFAGAVYGELRTQQLGQKDWKKTLKPAGGATFGRILGTVAKFPIAIMVWLTLTIAAFWP